MNRQYIEIIARMNTSFQSLRIEVDHGVAEVALIGPGKGNAYWSLRCADGTAWAVQIDPLAAVTAIDCDTFNANGAGKECFKKF